MRLSSKAVCRPSLPGTWRSWSGCDRIGTIFEGRRAFKEPNALYQAQDYKAASGKSRGETCSDSPEQDDHVYFFLANSYDNLSLNRPRRGKDNDAY